jgi:2-polyprenyl-3-methyl-5-hydroxy-6-metoxy-1,4-benzoquinol methylase
MTAKEHYESHLSHFYSWMAGDFETKQREHQQIFKNFGITSHWNARAIDLGAGHGIQSVALASLGFEVTAVDFNASLLDELRKNSGQLPIKTIELDLLAFAEENSTPADLIICMGDTLTHVRSIDLVEKLFGDIHRSLTFGGKMVLSFRDLTIESKGEQRFIPVKNDQQRILTCFLEFSGSRDCS